MFLFKPGFFQPCFVPSLASYLPFHPPSFPPLFFCWKKKRPAWLLASSPILSIQRGKTVKCSLCNENIRDNEPVSNLTESGLQSFQELANRWVNSIQAYVPRHCMLNFNQLQNDCLVHVMISLHENCRITFRNRLTQKVAQSLFRSRTSV